MVKIKINKIKCKRCGYEWIPRDVEVRTCANPKCRSVWWDKEKKIKKNEKV